MNFVKKMILILTIIILYSGASFASINKWKNDSIESTEYGDLLTLIIFENGLKEKNIGIIFPSDECSSYDSIPINAPSMYINNTKVQMMAQCLAKGKKMDFPKTSAGRHYVINELRNKNQIIYKQGGLTTTFKAKGFTSAYNSFESISGGL